MANAVITGHTGTKTSSFNLIVSFDSDVSGFDLTDINVTGAVTDITWRLFGSGAGYNVSFHVPEGLQGSLHVDLTGEVTPAGGSRPEAITVRAVSVDYDTKTSIHARFGELRYSDNNKTVTLPIQFEEDVEYFHKTDCEIRKIYGDDIFDMDYYLTSLDAREYEITFLIPPGRRGAFKIDITGYVFNTLESIRDDVIITPKLVPYNTIEPYLEAMDIPDRLTPGTWDIFFQTNVPCIGVGVDDFIGEGPADVNPGTPTLYRACSLDVEPERPSARIDADNPPETVGDWVRDTTGDTRVPAKYFILRFNVPPAMNGKRYAVSHRRGTFKPPIPGP